MATYTVGSSKIRPEFNALCDFTARFPAFRVLNISRNSPQRCFALQLDTKTPTIVAKEPTESNPKPTLLNTNLVPNSAEIEALLEEICSTTSIAEFELKLSGFHLYVQRQPPAVEAVQPPSPLPSPIEKASESNGSASTSLVLVDSSPAAIKKSPDEAPEGLYIVTSPAVGVFQTSFTIKGKRLPPCCTLNQIVKSGTIVGCVELLSGRKKLKTTVTGEVVKFLRKDGEPVGYGDPLIAILPSFPGIKNLLPSGND